MNRQIKLSALAAALLGAVGMLVALLSARAATIALPQTQTPRQAPVAAKVIPTPAPVRPVAVIKLASQPSATLASLDERHQYALGMIETGNDDRAVGGAGEVSRYQIMPSVWLHYSDSLSYRNPQVSLAVARHHWTALYNGFKEQAHREPTDFDMYVLWNTHYGYYGSKGFSRNRLAPSVRDRAQRYVNLVQDGEI
jgi:hypothetical protein